MLFILLSCPDYKGWRQEAWQGGTIKSIVKGGAPYPDGAQHWGGITPAGAVFARRSSALGRARGCVRSGIDLRKANDSICRVDLQHGECERKQEERSSPELAPQALVMGPLGPGRGRGRKAGRQRKEEEKSAAALFSPSFLPSFLCVCVV